MSNLRLNLKTALFSPQGLTLLASVLLLVVVIMGAGGDPLELARLGTQYSQGDPEGTQGYDGQFVYYIARDLQPDNVAPLLDNPAYRYQRILLPLLGRVISLGNLNALPWVLAAIGIISHTTGTWLVSQLLTSWGVNRWYALVYGLWVGFLLAVRLDLPEPLAYGLVAAAILARERQKPRLSWLLYGFAFFAKEVTIIFAAAQILLDLSQKRWRQVIGLSLVGLLPFMLFQVWLWQVFGKWGINSGGAMSTSFELIPFRGIFLIGRYSITLLIAILVVYTPFVIWPALWGIWASARRWLVGQREGVILFLMLNAIVIPFLPFSTFREPGGTLRFTCGLVLAVLLFAGKYRLTHVLNFSWFWLVLNVILLN
ncbi:MAG: hypothetical protein FVQ83_09395 [Chloroflexi bacterium]|nr:hypothetical protein [Chloroflexota bacterium]